MTTNNSYGIIGIDNKVPIYQPEARWTTWALHEIYLGTEGENRYIPKVSDYVIDVASYTTYIVESLNPITFIPVLVEIRPSVSSGTFESRDILLGVGPASTSEIYRAYLNTSVTPYTLTIDQRLYLFGTLTSYIKVFRGGPVPGQGEVISKVFDSGGNFVSESVQLQMAEIDSHTNYAVKVAPPFNCTVALPDAEVLTVVAYSDRGHIVSKRQVLVENTTIISSLNISRKFITHISMDSPFMSPTFDHVIDYPLNIPMSALNLMGTVHYSDGSKMRSAIDGGKFRVYGLDHIVSTVVGQKMDLVLSYALSDNEISYATGGVEGKFITEPYTLKTVNSNNSYTVKLFGYPIWVNQAVGYTMAWYLLNLDRNISIDVTSHVTFAENTGPFNPKGYGYLQRKSVMVNLRDISGGFKPFIHTQVVDIVLFNEPQNGTSPWKMSHEVNDSRPSYGENIHAARVNGGVNISSGMASLSDWLDKVYDRTYPLIDPTRESTILTPTHFIVVYNGISTEYPIVNWNHDLSIGANIPYYKTLIIKFIKRTSTGDLQLAVSAMVIKP